MSALARFCLLFGALLCSAQGIAQTQWRDVEAADTATLSDDDLSRHAGDAGYLDGLSISEARFTEAGFHWHLIRFVNKAKPIGPLWAVPHDDENAAFDAAIAAVKAYGGVAIMVNSGVGSNRRQSGYGTCGGRSAMISSCDPNRNFSDATPLFTNAHIEQLAPNQPIIALHTNSPGHGHGRGDITILDARAAATGKFQPRANGFFGGSGPESLNDYDTYAIIPFKSPHIGKLDIQCRNALIGRGVNVWHERIGASDGSFSNYVALSMRGTAYVNMESRRELDLAVAAERHRLMIAAYINGCSKSGD
jgi:hypothetical protein